MRRRLAVIAALGLALTPYLVGTARAASSCTWDATTATLEISRDLGDIDTLLVSGSNILFNGVSCHPAATTATVDTISVTGRPLEPGEDPTTIVVDLAGGPFAPGATPEPTGTSEIEFIVVGGIDAITIRGTRGDDVFSFGDDGVNLNNDDDVDLTIPGLLYLGASMRGGVDRVRGTGDAIVGEPYPHPLQVSGGPGDDRIRGGAGDDFLGGEGGADDIASVIGPGSDVLVGGAGDDLIVGGPYFDWLEGNDGNDTLDGRGRSDNIFGGRGRDLVSYAKAVGAISVKLPFVADTPSGVEQLGGIEDVIGSRFADTLVGGGAANAFRGARGNDLLRGGAGHDELHGGRGTDLLRGEVGNDTLNGGSGTDTCYQDGGSGPKTSCEKPVAEVRYSDTFTDPNDVPIDPTSCCQQDPDIRRTTRKVWLDTKNRWWVTISFATYEFLDDYWSVRVRLDARGDRRYDATMWIFDSPPAGCTFHVRGSDVTQQGRLRLSFEEKAACRVPRAWLEPKKRIRWKLFSRGGAEGTGPAVDEYAPDNGWYT